jgi:alkylation response protein AidB-like acyl-CoA dehydrogenase
MARLRATGIFGLDIPVEYGGLGFTLTEYLRVIEELAGSDMSLAIIPLAHLSIGMKGILLFGSEEQKRRYLPRAASGELVFAYALTGPKTYMIEEGREVQARDGRVARSSRPQQERTAPQRLMAAFGGTCAQALMRRVEPLLLGGQFLD